MKPGNREEDNGIRGFLLASIFLFLFRAVRTSNAPVILLGCAG